MEQVDNIVRKEYEIPQTAELCLDLERQYNFAELGVDGGGMGAYYYITITMLLPYYYSATTILLPYSSHTSTILFIATTEEMAEEWRQEQDDEEEMEGEEGEEERQRRQRCG
jgi:hypothetical protein